MTVPTALSVGLGTKTPPTASVYQEMVCPGHPRALRHRAQRLEQSQLGRRATTLRDCSAHEQFDEEPCLHFGALAT